MPTGYPVFTLIGTGAVLITLKHYSGSRICDHNHSIAKKFIVISKRYNEVLCNDKNYDNMGTQYMLITKAVAGPHML